MEDFYGGGARTLFTLWKNHASCYGVNGSWWEWGWEQVVQLESWGLGPHRHRTPWFFHHPVLPTDCVGPQWGDDRNVTWRQSTVLTCTIVSKNICTLELICITKLCLHSFLLIEWHKVIELPKSNYFWYIIITFKYLKESVEWVQFRSV